MHTTAKWIYIKSNYQEEPASKPQSREPKGSKKISVEIFYGRIFEKIDF